MTATRARRGQTTSHRPAELTTRPSVSVVVPCYNYGRFLSDSVGSVLSQRDVDVDVVIVDDASTDDSAHIARSLADADARVRVLVHEENRGHIQTYNDGLRLATGEYVALLSADDMLAPDALLRAAALMESHSDVGLVYGAAVAFHGAAPMCETAVREWLVYPGRVWLERVCRTAGNPISSPEVVMRRAAWLDAGPYDPRLPHCADLALWMATGVDWDIGRVDGPPQALYRMHDSAMHVTVNSGALRDLRERRRTFELLFTERLPPSEQADAMHERAREALARLALRLAMGRNWWDAADPPVDELRDFARETWPPIERSVLWVRLSRRARSGQLDRRYDDLLERARIRWDWWRWQV
jgi:glycosyltransferase involved in cell wall biosynthesis